MKLLRNALFVAIMSAWLVVGTDLGAAGGDICLNTGGGCDSSCCLANGSDIDCNGWCGYCVGGSGTVTNTPCSGEYNGMAFEGTICQCESAR